MGLPAAGRFGASPLTNGRLPWADVAERVQVLPDSGLVRWAYHRAVNRAADPPPRLSGLWMCLTGTLLFALVYGLLEPVYHWSRFVRSVRACPNYGANGNYSVFGDSGLDLLLLLFGLIWLLLVVGEQAVPISWRNRHPVNFLLRAAAAIAFSAAVVLFLPFQLAVVCH